jgi:hypothetical protein
MGSWDPWPQLVPLFKPEPSLVYGPALARYGVDVEPPRLKHLIDFAGLLTQPNAEGEPHLLDAKPLAKLDDLSDPGPGAIAFLLHERCGSVDPLDELVLVLLHGLSNDFGVNEHGAEGGLLRLWIATTGL